MPNCASILLAVLLATSLAACSNGGKGADASASGYPETPYTIHDESELIGGPNAQGRVGDVLLKNDKIRVIIQKPGVNTGVNSFGGNIIDADIVRPAGEAGQDSFGALFPLINVEWTVRNTTYEAVGEATEGGTKVLRARGRIDVYEYLDFDFIGDVAEGVTGQRLTFSNRFDDRRNPFAIYEDLKGLNPEVITDFTLEPGKSFVRIDTTFANDGEEEVRLPIGQVVTVSGKVSMLIPGIGFTPDLMTQVGGNTPAMLWAAFDDADASYGYFYPAEQFKGDDGAILDTGSVSYSGVNGILFGEGVLKLLPLGQGATPEIHFTIPPGSKRTVTSFLVVGNGSPGSVMDAGLEAIGAIVRPISGQVVDAAGGAVKDATVVVQSKGATVVAYRTDAQGRFGGSLPSGGNAESLRFGSGRYQVAVEMPGFQKNGTADAGSCEPAEIDIATRESAGVTCTLGESGRVEVSGPVLETESGRPVPARLTIVGADPSPNKPGGAGRFRSTYNWEQPFGIVDVKFITARGTIDLTGKSSFALEPGTYLMVISRGPEYASLEQVLEVPAGGAARIESPTLSRVVKTPGFVSGDFHIHSILSPDSNVPLELRVLSAAAEGLDVLHSSDHDMITDYGTTLDALIAQGLIPAGSMATVSGDEVTPNHYGHLKAFPLTAKPEDPAGGAMNWATADPLELPSLDPKVGPTLEEIIATLRADPADPVIQVNHLFDNPTGLPLACGWVTTPFYLEGFGVAPLSSYADPVERRLPPRASGTAFPIPYGESGLVTADFDAAELVIAPQLHDDSILFRAALPTWFNFLNLGILATATANSDSHRIAADAIGLPRNYIASATDPEDGAGASRDALDLRGYADAIKAHRVVVSAGPFIALKAKADDGSTAEVGGTVKGRHVKFTAAVTAPAWAWFDTVEVYANTEPVPVDDATDMPMQGTAADPAEFYKPYHTPRYTYQPEHSFNVAEGTLRGWKQENGLISATVEFDLNVSEDTWVVVVARGTRTTEGYRSLFPVVTRALVDETKPPEEFDPANIAAFHADKRVGAAAWALTNPIFIDCEGDGFTAKYVREGVSPLTSTR